MSEISVSKPPKYPWYQIGKLENLEQGDLLPNCPAIHLTDDLKPILTAKQDDEVDLLPSIEEVDLIIMTQGVI